MAECSTYMTELSDYVDNFQSEFLRLRLFCVFTESEKVCSVSTKTLWSRVKMMINSAQNYLQFETYQINTMCKGVYTFMLSVVEFESKLFILQYYH